MGRTGRAGRPQGGDSTETFERILTAARTHFAVSGYRSTTNKLIADDVGITPGALYHYIPSKAALYAEVYRSTVDHVYSDFERVAAAESNLVDRFLAVLRRAAEMQADDATITGFIVAVTQETRRHPDLLALLGNQRGRHTAFFTWLVELSVDSGELGGDVDTQAIADLLGSILTGLARLAGSTGDPMRYERAVASLRSLLAGTMLAR